MLVEAILNPPLRLTTNQKKVLLTVFNESDPETALSQIIGEKPLAALNSLGDFGFIDLTEDGASITEDGKDSLRKAKLIDDSDTITQAGRDILSTDKDKSDEETDDSVSASPTDDLEDFKF